MPRHGRDHVLDALRGATKSGREWRAIERVNKIIAAWFASEPISAARSQFNFANPRVARSPNRDEPVTVCSRLAARRGSRTRVAPLILDRSRKDRAYARAADRCIVAVSSGRHKLEIARRSTRALADEDRRRGNYCYPRLLAAEEKLIIRVNSYLPADARYYVRKTVWRAVR